MERNIMTISVHSAYEIGLQSQVVQQFYECYWHKKIALLIDEFYNWQFINTPTANGLDHCCVAVDDITHELVGVMGISPRPFYLNGCAISGAELTSWIVHPNYQGKGIGSY